jgi:branched-subunit amino acid aminotransferase/4-amino-4-deoxychorismate lyase
MPASFRDSLALQLNPHSRAFDSVPFASLSWSIHDVGTLYGAILVERFRTYGGRLVGLSQRTDRLFYAAKLLHINTEWIESQFEANCLRLLAINRGLIEQEEDASIVVLLSPGESDETGRPSLSGPTCMFHLSPLPFSKLADWYRNGTPLVWGEFSTVPSSCWPTEIKSRSRMPYLLSSMNVSPQPCRSLAVLKTSRGTIADTSVANVLTVSATGEVASPPKADILVGCTLTKSVQLLAELGIEVVFRDLNESDFLDAREVILSGSSGGIWHACSINGVKIGGGSKGDIAIQLSKLWKEYVGLDFEQQAYRHAS